MKYINHFGKQSENYLQFRPSYPDKLFSYLANLVPEHELVWDCGTGNGQAAVALAKYFKEVIATDVNQKQLDVAIKKENVHYHCWPAEKTEIKNSSVDLITIAQALHWFDFDNFYREVHRVAKSNGIIAAVCYSLATINPKIDRVVLNLYENILGDAYWPKERHYIDEQYQTIPFPFQKIQTPEFLLKNHFSFSQLIGFLNTWSAVKAYQEQNQQNPVDFVYAELKKAWGNLQAEHLISWPLHLLVGRVHV